MAYLKNKTKITLNVLKYMVNACKHFNIHMLYSEMNNNWYIILAEVSFPAFISRLHIRSLRIGILLKIKCMDRSLKRI